jgi:hypothetical protein
VKHFQRFSPPNKRIRQWACLVVFILALGLLSLSATQTGQADGGGWPTATPTFILFPTATSLPTTEPYPYPKTLPTQFQMQAALPSPTFFLPTVATETGSGSTFVCWPFALALLLVVILGSTVIFRRVKT